MSGYSSEIVLVIEDDPDTAALVVSELAQIGHSSHCVSDGRDGLNAALNGNFILVIIDLGLPSLGGVEICRQVRARRPELPLLILTADQDESKLVLGFEAGADEFMTKPFRVVEFHARVRALLRRARGVTGSGPDGAERINCGELVIDIDSRQVFIANKLVELTRTEYELLSFLASNIGRTFSRSELVAEIWGAGPAAYEQNIRSHLSNLRSKLKEAGAKREYVETRRGFGYSFVGQGQNGDSE